MFRSLAILCCAMAVLAQPAAADNPDGPLGLLTVEVVDSWLLASGSSTTTNLIDAGGSDFNVTLYAPVTSWLTVGTQARYWNQEWRWEDQTSYDTQDYYWGIRARVHIPVTERARGVLSAR